MSALGDIYFANVNYLCNERCSFCAAGLADGPRRVSARPRGVTTDDVESWLACGTPQPDDMVLVAGGEPTLHHDLLKILERLSVAGAPVRLFTNGLRLADRDYAEALLDAGVAEVLISLFGEDAEHHDSITRRRGSFSRTLQALANLDDLRRDRDFLIEVRLLVSCRTLDQNAGIVRLLQRRVPNLDRVSINRLILSGDADVDNAAVSWAEATDSVNETLALVRAAGIEAGFEAVPLCVFTGDNAVHVRQALGRRPARTRQRLHYLDPFTATGVSVPDSPPTAVAAVAPCETCALVAHCGGVEVWHVDRFGTAGIRPVAPDSRAPHSMLPESARAEQ